MAQTRKRRSTKHRGNAVGMIENRGRTGRRPDESERKLGKADEAKLRRERRASRPPSWRAALNRAAVSALIFFVVVLVLLHENIGVALGLAAFVMIFYVPLGYYTDAFIYRRRLARKASEGRR